MTNLVQFSYPKTALETAEFCVVSVVFQLSTDDVTMPCVVSVVLDT